MSHERRTTRWWKERWVAGHYAVLRSRELLEVHMRHQGYNPGTLATEAGRQRRRMTGNPDVGCTRQMIWGLLHRDDVRSCKPDLAIAIEKALDLPDGILFDIVPKSRVERQTDHGRATTKKGRAA